MWLLGPHKLLCGNPLQPGRPRSRSPRRFTALFSIANGHVTETAADGAEVVRLVERKGLRPDLVIVDYNLPHDLSGLQVLARLGATLGPGLPAIVLTGDIDRDPARNRSEWL